MKKFVLVSCVLVMVLSVLSLNAQTFTLISSNFSGIDPGNDISPAFTDIDGDGLFDLLVGERMGQIWHYEQDSENSLSFPQVTANWNSIDVGVFAAPTFTDIDGDGLLDMIVGERWGTFYHYEQNSIGSATFTLVTHDWLGIDVGHYAIPTFTDLDGDGLLDFMTGDYSGVIQHYEQNSEGSAAFTLVSSSFNGIDPGASSSPEFIDIDGDDLLDLLIGKGNGTISHYEQDAEHSLSFTLVTNSWQGIDVFGKACLAFNDIDGDNYLDFFLGKADGKIEHYESDLMTGGSEPPDTPENVVITHDGADVTISWDAVTGATSYKICSDTDPYGAFTNIVVENHPASPWSGAASDSKLFYHVIAVN